MSSPAVIHKLRKVHVATGARLHFGFFTLDDAGPSFGGLGVMIDEPGVRLTVERRDDRDEPLVQTSLDRVQAAAEHFWKRHADRARVFTRVEVTQTIPPHQGLGSGTQLALAVGKGLALLSGQADMPVTELAASVGRGARSAVGVHGFAQGGWIVDGGKERREQVGRLEQRIEFPAEWRFVLVLPPTEAGLSGEAERQAFGCISAMPAELSTTLQQLARETIVPAIERQDIATAGAGLSEFGERVGSFFAPIQGGTLASPMMRDLAVELNDWDMVAGYAQSSWGPTIAVLVESPAAARNFSARMTNDARWQGCQLKTVAGLNCGARLETE